MDRSQARVNIDYHVAYDGNWYSVPYSLTGEQVDVRSTPATVEIFHRGKRVASHLRSRERNKPVTQNEHRPKSHQIGARRSLPVGRFQLIHQS